ncbi:MAG TPA: acyltransferase [Woeseiaceae bacterium]|nr:acyltransferase [Woeseiaceae bacterium]
MKNLRALAAFAALTVNTILWCMPLFVLALVKLLLPVPALRRAMTRSLMWIGESWVSGNALILGLGPARVEVRGAGGLNRRGWYLVISNHRTWVDIVVLQTVFNRRIPFLKFFIKQELVWFPFLGLAWWALDMPFMKRHSKSYLAKHPEKKGEDLRATRAACEKFRDAPTSVINFVEGTRYTEEKRAKRASPYRHLLPPRAGGVALALTSMGSMFDAILDVTLVYVRERITFWDLCRGELDGVVVDIEQRAVEPWMSQGDYAEDREFRAAFHRWLSGIWHEKDAKIGAMRNARNSRGASVTMPGVSTTAGDRHAH